MNGMFARLSARAGGLDGAPVGALRPRSPSLFEPGPSAWNAGGFEPEEGGFPEAAAPLPPPRQRPSDSSGAAPPALAAPEATAATAPTGERSSPPALVVRRPEADPARRDLGEGSRPDVALQHTVPAPASVPASAPNRGFEPSAAAESGPDGDEDRKLAELDGADHVPSPVPILGTPPSPPVAGLAVLDVDVVTARADNAHPVRRLVASALPSALLPRRPPPATRRDTEASGRTEPPAIHVTIGRVEVRAVQPPPATVAAKRRTEPAVTTLDAYLRQRAHRS